MMFCIEILVKRNFWRVGMVCLGVNIIKNFNFFFQKFLFIVFSFSLPAFFFIVVSMPVDFHQGISGNSNFFFGIFYHSLTGQLLIMVFYQKQSRLNHLQNIQMAQMMIQMIRPELLCLHQHLPTSRCLSPNPPIIHRGTKCTLACFFLFCNQVFP